jgi:D-tyrosyl-tRNA(Tyr) deacylase
MKAVLQRVRSAKVLVEERPVAEIGTGLLILLGVNQADDERVSTQLADKCAKLRIFEDAAGKMNLSLTDVRGEALVVSQFTLYADTQKGLRPSFTDAAPPEKAEQLYQHFIDRLHAAGIPVRNGIFGARMLVTLENTGPVTIILEA